MAYIGNSPANVGGYQIVDDISASFDGSTTSFALTASSSTITPVKTGQLLVGLNGVMQEPDDTGTDGFKVSGSNIVFSSAPTNGDTFWAVYQGQNVDVGTPSAGTVGAAELKDDSVTNIKMADDAIGVAELSATGTANTSVYLRGDNSWATPTDTGLLNVVEDTTPQLGGDLASNGNDINFGDNDKGQFGAGNDLQIFHDGSNSFINDTGTGGLNVRASSAINLQTPGGAATLATFTENGSSNLYYSGSSKMSTVTAGVDVTGTVVCDGADLQGNVLDNPKIKDYSETVNADSGSITIGSTLLNNGNVIHWSGSGTISFDTPSSTYAGVSCTVICQAAPTISGTNVIWNGGEAPTTSGVCVYTFFCGITTGSTYKWFGVEVGKDFA